MKKLLLLFIVLTSGSYSYGQASVYHPFPVSDAVWRENSGGYQCGCCMDYQYFITGDTTIGSYLYHKVRKSGVHYAEDISGNCTNIITSFTNEYAGAYRQDSVAREVYFVQPGIQTDTLLYDFNLNLGDTLSSSYLFNSASGLNYVTSIDSVLIGNNYHKRIFLSNGMVSNYAFLVEGLGSSFGFLGQLYLPFEFGTTLICFMINGSTVYPDTNSTCDIVTFSENSNAFYGSLFLSPNPATSYITLSMPPLQGDAEVCVFNSLGKQVLKTKVHKAESEVRIDVAKLPAGLYFVKTNNYSGKFVKQ